MTSIRKAKKKHKRWVKNGNVYFAKFYQKWGNAKLPDWTGFSNKKTNTP